MPDSVAQRAFALEVVRQLRAAGFEAVWAGGCVRDQLLGLTPKDYDVATNATPEQVREVFGRRKTIPVGAAFGVIALVGSREAGTVEVATFRRDMGYTDGRRPDAVAFTTAEEDAQRRDFTINGIFYDPVGERVLDYVGGQEDLQRGIVRAIGDPRERFTEDKLRMLRAVRFAATFDFTLEKATFAAVRAMAAEIQVVSAERIGAELRRMMINDQRAIALRFLLDSGLLSVLLPEIPADELTDRVHRAERLLFVLEQPSFALAFGTLLFALQLAAQSETIGRRLRLSNDEIERSGYLARNGDVLDEAKEMAWTVLQRLLVHPGAAELVALHAARAWCGEGSKSSVEFCQELLAWPTEKLNPPPLITGDDLKQHGIRPGPQFKMLLDKVRDAQLEGRVTTKGEALELAGRVEKEG